MASICLCFQVHQPFRLRRDFDFFSIGSQLSYEDTSLTAAVVRKVAQKCYLPANQLMLKLVNEHKGKFKIAYSLSGVCLEQFEQYCPEVIASFKKLVQTGCVELLGETYYHSLSFLFSKDEFQAQVRAHEEAIGRYFDIKPTTFRNTELVYNNQLAEAAEAMGYRLVLLEGADRLLGWRSPNFVYRPASNSNLRLLLRNYRLSDDIAFRFSNAAWEHYPLTAEKYAHWIHSVGASSQVINLFMDYETLGEHQWADTGIFQFMQKLPTAAFARENVRFQTPTEVTQTHVPVGIIDSPYTTSWADTERDTSAWLGNEMQRSAMEYVYSLESRVRNTGSADIIHAWRKLTTSDHFYYMSTKRSGDGEVHRYFNPFPTPYDAYVTYTNAVNHLNESLIANSVVREERPAREAIHNAYL
ncbi:MAG: alpha-amylase [Deltaproteobacteria bacterium]|nr:alpha-amylase [Deltaproteobacteria bacterium]